MNHTLPFFFAPPILFCYSPSFFAGAIPVRRMSHALSPRSKAPAKKNSKNVYPEIEKPS
ncbi:consensus disorder prediction [Desulfoluna spongiiphila]|nr:consensus disorder prediction [Desulfoluna spongiiphila]